MSQSGGYDTIHLFSECHPGKNIPELTSHARANGATWKSGHLKNLRIYVSDRGTSIQGSFAANRYDTNWVTLNPSETGEQIDILSEDTGIDWFEAVVTRIDYAQTIIVDHKPNTYYPYLGIMPKLERFTKPQSLYYENKQETFLLYDKGEDARKKKIAIPDCWKGCNVLRPELRLLKPKRLLKKTITGKDLTRCEFTCEIADRYKSRYDSIHKLKPIRINADGIRTPKDFSTRLEALGIEQIGLESIGLIIEELKAKQAFSNSKAYSRISTRIRGLLSCPRHTHESPILEELTRKIHLVL